MWRLAAGDELPGTDDGRRLNVVQPGIWRQFRC